MYYISTKYTPTIFFAAPSTYCLLSILSHIKSNVYRERVLFDQARNNLKRPIPSEPHFLIFYS